MTDYSSDASTSSNESIASFAEEAEQEFEEASFQRALEESLDVVMKHHDGYLRYPFNKIRNPFVAIDKGMSGRATNEDVMRRLNDREQRIWTSLWTFDHIKVESDQYLDTDALDALIEVGFRAIGGTDGDMEVAYSVICALLDARIGRRPPSAPAII